MDAVAKPWYREPWPWILMAGPFIVVVAGIVTAWIAVKTNDGLVTEDYYKKGLAVHQTIAQSERAKAMGVRAEVTVNSEHLAISLSASDTKFVIPPTLRVTVSHPTRAGLDQVQVLQGKGNTFQGTFRLPASGHWLIMVEDETKSWRLMGNVILPAAGPAVLGGASEPADIRN